MKILFEHDGILPVTRYGGTERVIFWHMRELVRQGHQVFCICDERSKLSEYGIHLIPSTGDSDWSALIPSGIDIIHLTYTPNFKLDIPYLVMINGNGKIGEYFPHNTVFVSRKHALNHGSVVFVDNGLDFTEYPFIPRPRHSWSDFLFLAKASWKVKNLKDCVAAARKSKKHLHVGGGRSWAISRFVRSYGMVDQSDKRELLGRCDALLFPVRWEEPFGLAVIEAMSNGLPVIASPYGSLPDLVKPKTGVICRDFSHLVEILSWSVNPFDPEEIRAYVESAYAVKSMTDKYLQYYKRIIAGEKLNKEMPCWKAMHAPEELLPF